MKNALKGKFTRLSATFLFCLLAVNGRAATISFYLNGATAPGGFLVYEKVTFITSANTIEVQIQNLTSNMRADTQAISSIDFLVSGISGLPANTTLALDTTGPNLGSTITFISTPSTYSALTPVFGSNLTAASAGWQLAASTLTSGIKLSTFPSSPNYLIGGPPPYTNLNGSMVSGSHNPFFETDGTTHIGFKLTFDSSAHIDQNTTISTTTMPRLNFGTTDAGGELTTVLEPEPGTVALMLGGLGLLCGAGIRRRKLTSSQDSALQA